MNKKWKLYVHISPNGKRYYGITSQKPEKRWQNGNGYKSNKYFWNAIKKYGWDNFMHEILFDNLTKEEVKLLEKIYITLYDTTNKNKGYNITKGGESANGLKHTEEWRKNMSEKMKGENSPFYGKHLSKEHKRKIGESHRGKHLSEEHKRKIGEKSKGRKNNLDKPVYIVELDKEFENVSKCANFLKCRSVSSVSNVLNNRNNTCKGYHIIYAEDTNNENINKTISKKDNRKIKIYCIELDKYFNSVTEASKYIGCRKSGISNVLNNRNNTCKGYHFIYAEDTK